MVGSPSESKLRDLADHKNIGYLVDDLVKLEKEYCTILIKERRFLSSGRLYGDVMRRIEACYARTNAGKDLSTGDHEILLAVENCLLSRKVAMDAQTGGDLVVNIKGYIAWIERDIAALRDDQKAQKIEFLKTEYIAEIEELINQSNLVMTDVKALIEKEQEGMRSSIQKIQKEIDKLKEAVKEEYQEKRRKLDEMKNKLIVDTVFDTLNALTPVLSLLGPAGLFIGVGVSAASGVARPIVSAAAHTGDVTLTDGTAALAGSLSAAVESFKKGRDAQVEAAKVKEEMALSNLSEAIANDFDVLTTDSHIEESIKQYSDKAKARRLKISDVSSLEATLKKAKTKNTKDYNIKERIKHDETLTNIQSSIDEEKKNIETMQSDLDKKKDDIDAIIKKSNRKIKENDLNHKNLKLKLEMAGLAINATTSLISVASNVVVGVQKIKNKSQEIDEDKKQKDKNLDDLKDILQKQTLDILRMSNDIVNVIEQGSQNTAALKFNQWKIGAELRHINENLKKITSQLPSGENLSNSINKFSELLDLIVDILEKIEAHRAQQRLVSFIAETQAAAATNIAYQNPQVRELIRYTKQNLVLQRYCKLLSVMASWTFPFAKAFHSATNILIQDQKFAVSDLARERKRHESKPATPTTPIVETCINDIEKIKKYNEDATVTIKDIHNKIIRQDFIPGVGSDEYFYKWSHEELGSSVRDLFTVDTDENWNSPSVKENFTRGLTVKLYASPYGSKHQAVRFKRIHLKMIHDDPNQQKSLDDLTNQLWVHLKHGMKSYFRIKDKYYEFGGNLDHGAPPEDGKTRNDNFHLEIQNLYSINLRDEKLNNTNESAYYHDTGDTLLSPYADWEVYISITKNARFLFDEIREKFAPYITLALVGQGYRVDIDGMTAEEFAALDVDRYYRPIVPPMSG